MFFNVATLGEHGANSFSRLARDQAKRSETSQLVNKEGGFRPLNEGKSMLIPKLFEMLQLVSCDEPRHEELQSVDLRPLTLLLSSQLSKANLPSSGKLHALDNIY